VPSRTYSWMKHIVVFVVVLWIDEMGLYLKFLFMPMETFLQFHVRLPECLRDLSIHVWG
jgi:hypothetical protein